MKEAIVQVNRMEDNLVIFLIDDAEAPVQIGSAADSNNLLKDAKPGDWYKVNSHRVPASEPDAGPMIDRVIEKV